MAYQAQPRVIDGEDLARKYPRVELTVFRDGMIRRVTGQVVGRQYFSGQCDVRVDGEEGVESGLRFDRLTILETPTEDSEQTK
jgi:hypothetical protein